MRKDLNNDQRLDFGSMSRAQRADSVWAYDIMRRSMMEMGEEASRLGLDVVRQTWGPPLPLLVEWALCNACLLGRILGFRPEISTPDGRKIAREAIEDGFAAKLYGHCIAVIEGDGYSFRSTDLTQAAMSELKMLFGKAVAERPEELHWLGFLGNPISRKSELETLEEELRADGTLSSEGLERLADVRSRMTLKLGTLPTQRNWAALCVPADQG